MRKIPVLLAREFGAYFHSSIAYVVLTVFLVSSGFFFCFYLVQHQQATLGHCLGSMAVILLFLSPIITMRLFSEEVNTGTMETLMTDPVTDAEVVAAKFFSALGFYIVLLLPTLSYVFVLRDVGNPDMGPVISGYIGLVLMGCLFLSVGMFFSAMTKNQIIAAVMGFISLMLMWIIGASARGDMPILKILSYIGIFGHFNAFRMGLIDSRGIIYYLSSTVLFLFLTVRVVESKRWR